MALPWTGRPKFFRYVPRPTNTANSEVAKAQPVFIDGLPEADPVEISDIEGLQAILTDFEDRISALEQANP